MVFPHTSTGGGGGETMSAVRRTSVNTGVRVRMRAQRRGARVKIYPIPPPPPIAMRLYAPRPKKTFSANRRRNDQSVFCSAVRCVFKYYIFAFSVVRKALHVFDLPRSIYEQNTQFKKRL